MQSSSIILFLFCRNIPYEEKKTFLQWFHSSFNYIADLETPSTNSLFSLMLSCTWYVTVWSWPQCPTMPWHSFFFFFFPPSCALLVLFLLYTLTHDHAHVYTHTYTLLQYAYLSFSLLKRNTAGLQRSYIDVNVLIRKLLRALGTFSFCAVLFGKTIQAFC